MNCSIVRRAKHKIWFMLVSKISSNDWPPMASDVNHCLLIFLNLLLFVFNIFFLSFSGMYVRKYKYILHSESEFIYVFVNYYIRMMLKLYFSSHFTFSLYETLTRKRKRDFYVRIVSFKEISF